MPVEITTFHLPGGARCVRVMSSGHLSGDDVDIYMKETRSGGPLVGLPQMVLTHRQDSISSEARGVFASHGRVEEKEPWVAVVAPNPMIRVICNFLIRVMRRKRVRLFNGEPEAVRWLDEQMRAE